MNAASSRLRSTGRISSDISAIWPGALLVGYLGVAGILLLVGRSRVAPTGIVLHFAMLGAIAATTWLRIVPRWLQSWAPLLVLLLLYAEMPMLIRAAGHEQLFDARVIAWEQSLFGGQPARAWAARWPSLLLSELLHAAYLSYYAIIFVVPTALYVHGRQKQFHEAVFALMLTFVVCFAWYIVFPVAGPRYLWPPGASVSGPMRTFTIWLLEARSARGTAFPSSHVAVAVTQAILAARYFGAPGAFVAVLAIGLALGAVYGGFHYAIDVVVGALVGAMVTGTWLLVVSRAAGRADHANAMAPT